MATKKIFDMYKLNRLPRQLVDDALPLESLEQNLIDSLPYIFKPNRVLALHPRHKDIDAGFPIRDRRIRWAIKLNIPDIFAPYTHVIAINREAWFSVWRYQHQNETGLFQVSLKSKNININDFVTNILQNKNFIYLNPAELNEEHLAHRLPYDFNILRLTQHCDEDGLVTIKLITRNHEHIIELDFGHYKFKQSKLLNYSHTINTVDADNTKGITRQIGDWNGENSFFWQDSPAQLKQGHVHDAKIIPSSDFPVKIARIWAVIEQKINNKTIRVLGGEGGLLYWYEDGKYKHLNYEQQIQGDIRSLALLPAEKCGRDYPLIVVGCNDFFLYIMTYNGKILQKANMGGAVDGLLYLNSQEKEWFDLIVLVRSLGLMCVRLFFDEFNLGGGAKTRKEAWHDATKILLEKQNLLSYLESEDINQQLLAVTYIIYDLSEGNLELFKQPDVLCQLNSQVKVYLLHRIKRELLSNIQPSDNIVMRTYQNNPNKMECLLSLLSYMTKEDYYSRVLVRNLKGWLLSLIPKHLKLKNQKAQVENIIKQIPDAKRLLQSDAKNISSGPDQKVSIGRFVNTWEFLKYKRNFNELIVVHQNKHSRVDSLTMLLTIDKQLGCINIYSLYGQNELADFSSLASLGDEYIFKKMGWDKSISDPNIKSIKCLLSVGENLIIAIADHNIGIATKERATIDWQIKIPDIVLWSAAYHPNYAGDAGLLAVGGEWHKGLSVIFTFKLGKDNKLTSIQINKLHLPDYWEGRTRFSKLKWDKKGGLWAVTGDKGELFHWENAVNNMLNIQPTTAKHLASNGNTQNALVILDDKVVCGGYDGVLRAFDFSGQLLWVNVYDSPIRAITSAQDNGGKPCADLAIAVEKYGLVLCNKEGIQQGHLSMQNRSITNMDSHIASKGGAQHHLIGMYNGEVRLVEEVPQDWTPKAYLDKHELWENIERHINQASEDKELCIKWCSLDAATKEPYRAIWAARQLLDKHQDFNTIIDLLTNEKIKQRQDPVVLELRQGLLGLLGKSLDQLPAEFHKQIIELCKYSEYGSFAQLLLDLPVLNKVDFNKLRLLRKLFNLAHEKIKFGNINVTSAVLQRLRLQKSAIPERDVEFFLLRALKDIQVFDNKVHIGYIEGLFAILFQQTKLAENGIFNVFMIINDKYSKIVNLLSRNDEVVKRFITWLNLYSRTLFSDQDYKLWMKICPELQNGIINKTILSDIIKNQQIGREEDRKLLKGFLSLFPHSEVCCTQLNGEWRQYVSLVKTLRGGSLAITNNLKNPKEVEQWIKEQQMELNKTIVKLPLLSCFEKLLFQAWRSELNTLRNTLTLSKPSLTDCKKHSLSIEVTPELTETVQRFFQTIQEGAYDSGVFCEVEHVLGSQRYLKPILSMGKQLKFDKLSFELNEFVTNQKPDILKYSKIEQFIIIPVIGTNPLSIQQLYIPADMPREKYIPAFAFVFEGDYDILVKQKDLQSGLCIILGQINNHITAQYNKRFKKRYNILANLENKYFKNQYYDEEGLFFAALDLADAKSGLLAMEFTETNSLKTIVSRGTENHYLHDEYFQIHPKITNPIIRCWQNAKALFLPNCQKSQELNNFKILSQQANQTESDIYKWLSDSNIASIIVLPIFAGFTNKKEGILLLSSQSPYFFTLERIAAVEQLLQKNRWTIEVKRLKEFQDYMQHLFVHEIRSEIIPINHAVADLEKQYNKEKLLEIKRHSDKAKDFIDNLLTVSGFEADMSSSFSDAHSVVNKFIRLHDNDVRQHQQKIIFEGGNEDLWHYATLLGNKKIYERVVRILLDNALKYGDKHADIHISVRQVDKYWQLTITNPGHMAEMENRLKFEPFAHPVDKNPNSPRTGTHLGLAASKRIVEAYGGQLFINNTVKNGEKRVQAILNWPFATGEKQ